MGNSVASLSQQEFEELVESVIDRRMEVWLTQLLDALGTEEDETDLQSEFVASLKRAIEQAETGKTMELSDFRQRLADE